MNRKQAKKFSLGQINEITMKYIFGAAAMVSVAAVGCICFFLFAGSFPAIRQLGIAPFLTGIVWRPSTGEFGILPMIVASAYVTAGSLIIGVPIGILTAVYMAYFCKTSIYRFLKPAVNLLAGIPSVVYGFCGLMVIVPMIRNAFGGTGTSMLAACVVLGIMILPTIINVTENSLRSVPKSYYEGSRLLGATHERSVFKVVFPAAKSGIMAGVILGVGRAVGETMAVIMVAGNQAIMPGSITEGLRTMTANIVLEMGYAQDLHREALIATAVVLFVFVLVINLCFMALSQQKEGEKQ